MARKSVIARERKRERIVAKYADRRKKLKAEGNWEELDKLPRNSNPIRLHNRCQLTGRPKGYMRDFGICRVMFRKMALEGKIPGITKSSW
ncbi:MAG TPA: 30S ribosomal protein S14 [Saprospiraceae bacterium]|nr:30S ribosomal protein S14 [Saprospiraceae bacterium]HQW54693.1 30S ribosomal protein S14 [Saprospiraceae bacterium]